jgi:hypothetical protein
MRVVASLKMQLCWPISNGPPGPDNPLYGMGLARQLVWLPDPEQLSSNYGLAIGNNAPPGWSGWVFLEGQIFCGAALRHGINIVPQSWWAKYCAGGQIEYCYIYLYKSCATFKQSPLAEYHPFNTSKVHALNAISPLGLPSAGAKYCVRGRSWQANWIH